jgi:apolipoprotein N-acyltransferase
MASSEPGYERLGAKILSLPDVIAQSVGFIGPVFSSAFVIPLVIGVISASGKGGGVASPISVLIAAVGVFALGWIVSNYLASSPPRREGFPGWLTPPEWFPRLPGAG